MFRGSNTEEGKFYHQNWFGTEPFQRLDSINRAVSILNNYNVEDKTVIDLGCNIGFFSFFFNNKKAKHVTGIDYDSDAIAFANKMKKEHEIEDVDFLNKEITVKELEKIGKVDCVNALAVLSWIMHQISRDEMENIIEWISKNSKVSFIEIQYNGEPGQLEWIHNDEECEKYLKQWFKYVYKVIKVTGWGPRTVWKCGNDVGEWTKIYSNNKTTCYISDNGFFKKVKEDENFTFDNEVKYLNKLKHKSYFPTVLKHTKNELLMTGFNSVDLNKLMHSIRVLPNLDMLARILFGLINCLEEHNIKHQDINAENLLITPSGSIKLVDFEYASELTSPIKNKLYKENKDVENVNMAKKVIEELERAKIFYNIGEDGA